jgi:pyrroline-5-carboxylate reductase
MQTLGFIGSGNMAEALARGALAAGVVQAANLLLSDVRADHRDALAAELGCRAAANNAEILAACDTVVLAVKPQMLADVLAQVEGLARPGQRFLSILAGARAEKIEAGLAHAGCPAPRVVRAMPNTPALVGCGATAITRGAHARDEDMAAARALFDAVGVTVEVEARHMDAVTGLSGSGPAYVFLVMEALLDAARAQGIPDDAADALVKQTVLGAGMLAKSSEHPPAELRRRVTSPGGTTAAGLAVLDERGFRQALVDAVDAATKRGAELGK